MKAENSTVGEKRGAEPGLCPICGVHGCVCQRAATKADVARVLEALAQLRADLVKRGSL